MLRSVVVVLVLANLLSWAYTEGFLGFAGLAPKVQREPLRMEQQVNPDKLRLVGPDGSVAAAVRAPVEEPAEAPNTQPEPAQPADPNAPNASNAPTGPTGPGNPAPTACWQAPGYSRAEAATLRSALEREPLLQGVWQLDEAVLPARWVVYLGPFPSTEALQRRRAELRAARIDHREVNNPALQPGLALGTYSTAESAQQALRDVRRQGINNARVEQERPDTPVFALRLPAATASQKALVEGLVEGLGNGPGRALAGRALQACP
jgi:hypothetical protein